MGRNFCSVAWKSGGDNTVPRHTHTDVSIVSHNSAANFQANETGDTACTRWIPNVNSEKKLCAIKAMYTNNLVEK